MRPNSADTNPPRTNVWKMFDRIAHRYDLLNHLLSFGQDIVWRSKVAKMFPQANNQILIDIATGTADQILTILNRNNAANCALGIDMSREMLTIGRKKIVKRNLSNRTTLLEGDALRLPVQNDSVDVVTISFGIRNLMELGGGLSEFHRVLKPNGKIIILEFSLPTNPLFRPCYLFYFRNVLPIMGKVISGDGYAYRYLNQTVESFPYGESFQKIMQEVGFINTQIHPLTLGIASIYEGSKEAK